MFANCPSDFTAAVGREFFDAGARFTEGAASPLVAGKEDVPAAYRTAPSDSQHLTVVALINPSSGKVHYFDTCGLNFGLSAAGYQFCRFPIFIIGAVRSLLAVPADLFTDDIQVIETQLSRGVSSGSVGLAEFPGSAHSSLVEFCGLSGLPLAALKRVIGSSAPVALGIQTDFSLTHINGTVCIRVAPATRAKVVVQALAALDRGYVVPCRGGFLEWQVWVRYVPGSGGVGSDVGFRSASACDVCPEGV